ncbi:MAG: GIY-YIG nuclease family protein [Patescibacteria group bacterium]
MYYVYFLNSKKSDATYVGFTRDLKLRLSKHNNGLSLSTKNSAPWELIYYEAYKSKEDARRRERMLKYDGRAKAMLKKRIEDSLSKKGAA